MLNAHEQFTGMMICCVFFGAMVVSLATCRDIDVGMGDYQMEDY